MKSKTSVTLATAVLVELDKVVGKNGNRSQAIEKAVHEYVQRLKRAEHYRRELDLLNRHARRLNEEAEDVLSYQVKL